MRDQINFTPDYGEQKITNSIIKVIGVGGGGGNAVKHMYREGIIGVDFLICNTDQQVLESNQVPSKLVLGNSGLGAGAKPEVARDFAMESREKIIEFIGKETKMLFITAGMGKGTGTGAAPVIAEIAQEMGILTIGVVTFPFKFEGNIRVKHAEEGIEELRKYVDSLIVVKNQNILKIYCDETMDAAFGFADDILKNAVKCIAELITVKADQNIDFNDIQTVMKNSGPAMLGLAEARGENRIEEVVNAALTCPLLDENQVTNAKNFLFFISYGKEAPLKISELGELTEKFERFKSSTSDVIWGRALDENLGDAIKLSVIVTNYNAVERAPTPIPIVPENEILLGEKNKEATIIIPENGDFNYLLKNSNDVTSKKDEETISFLQEQNNDIKIISSPDFPFADSNTQNKYHAGAQLTQISEYSDSKFENDDEFTKIVEVSAFERKHQENRSALQEQEVRMHQQYLNKDNSDIHSLFGDLPD